MSSHIKADFFVHPDYHRASYPDEASHPQVLLYEQALHRRLGGSVLPILLYDPELCEGRGEFWGRFDPAHRFPSKPDMGILDADQAEHDRFNSLMNDANITGGLVHGSYTDACVVSFRASLLTQENNTLTMRPPNPPRIDGGYKGPENVKFGVTLTSHHVTIPSHGTGSHLAPQFFAPNAETYFY